jgi:hypothetical protein
VKIFCPHCGQVHAHGKAAGPGHVTSHCLDPREADPNALGYIIPEFDTYDPREAAELEKIAAVNKRKSTRARMRSVNDI